MVYNRSLLFVFDIGFEMIIDNYRWINLVIHKIKPRSNTSQVEKAQESISRVSTSERMRKSSLGLSLSDLTVFREAAFITSEHLGWFVIRTWSLEFWPQQNAINGNHLAIFVTTGTEPSPLRPLGAFWGYELCTGK